MRIQNGNRPISFTDRVQGLSTTVIASVLGISLFLAYRDTFSKILRTDAASDGFHSLLVAGISGYIIWRKRAALLSLRIEPQVWGGGFLTLFGCFLLVVGKLSYTPFIKEISFVPTLLGIIWLCLGGRFLRELWFPVACLIFMFPFVGEIFGGGSIYLQYIAAWIGAKVIEMSGLVVFLEGQYIALPHIKLEVAEVCNGSNHIITMVALAVLLAWGDQNSKLKQGILIFAGGVIGILANGLRVGAIGLWSSYYPNRPLHGPGDILYVSIIFIFALFLLLGINMALRKWDYQPRSARQKEDRKYGQF